MQDEAVLAVAPDLRPGPGGPLRGRVHDAQGHRADQGCLDPAGESLRVGIEVMGGEQRAPRGEAVALGQGIGGEEGPGYEGHGITGFHVVR